MKDFTIETLKALLGLQSYFELPQMYTTSTFHKPILDQARELQSGKVFSAHPQDENLAAIAYSLEKTILKIIYSTLLGWMWHPEREQPFSTENTIRVKRLFNGKK